MKNIISKRILDATLRDGGIINDFFFSDEFAKALYLSNVNSGVDYMEFGYRADKKQFNVNEFGKWKFTSDEDIRNIIGSEKADLKVSVMVDVGKCDVKRDIAPKSESPVDIFRIATYIDTLEECNKIAEYIHSLGYQVTCNLMAVSTYSEKQLKEALNILAQMPISAAYVVDSYGALYPEHVRKLLSMFIEKMNTEKIAIGIHSHNNQQCSFANTLEAANCGAYLLDGTVMGVGRGAGNCPLELLVGHLNGEKYHLEPILDFIEDYMIPFKKSGAVWGYNTSYMLTGITNNHPKSAIEATKTGNLNFNKQFKNLSK